MAHVEEMVSRQVMLSRLKRRLEEEGHRDAPAYVEGVAYGPCLLVSRERGSGGRQVAGLVGQRLGWWVFDREIVEEIAARCHVRQKLIESVDERVRSNWRKGWEGLVNGAGIPAEEYLLYLRQIILSLGHHGDVVIMGRGAQYLLPSRAALRARLVAPLEIRAERVAARERLPLGEARRQIEACDGERDEFIRRTFACDPHSPLNYDLVLNTGETSIEAAAEIVLSALGAKLGVRPGMSQARTGNPPIHAPASV